MKRYVLWLLLIFGLFSAKASVQASPGFAMTDQGVRWVNDDGTWAYNCWLQGSGRRYHVDAAGNIQIGLQNIGGDTYYFMETGVMGTGWITIGNDIYYFNEEGKMQKNTSVNGCVLGADGRLQKAGTPGEATLQAQAVESILAAIIKPGMSDEQKLKACYNYMINASSYKRTYETPTGDWTGAYALDILTSGQGNCYRYAAGLAHLIKGLGYDARVATGQIAARRGGLTPHAWTEVRIGYEWYIFDCEMHDAKNGAKNYYQRTYENYPSKPLLKQAIWPVYL